MSGERPGCVAVWLRLAFLAASLWCGPIWADGTQVVVSGDHATLSINRELLRAIFTTRLRQWPDGTQIRVFVMPDDSALHDQFCREQLGMYPYVLRELWDRLQFTGTGLTPTVVHSEVEMRTRVESTPGAIGYLPSNTSHASADSAGPTPSLRTSTQQQRNIP